MFSGGLVMCEGDGGTPFIKWGLGKIDEYCCGGVGVRPACCLTKENIFYFNYLMYIKVN